MLSQQTATGNTKTCCFSSTNTLFPKINISSTTQLSTMFLWYHFIHQHLSQLMAKKGTYHIGDQQRLRQACASAQSHQSHCCLLTQYMTHVMRKPVYGICEQQRRSLISTFVVRFLDSIIPLLAVRDFKTNWSL